MERYVSLIVLFCASAMGIFGALSEGLGNGITLLATKAILDFFTALIFATTMGPALALIAIPQMAIQLVFALIASPLEPIMNPSATGNFSAVGGIIMLATGFRLCGIKAFPVANLLPSLVFAIPVTYLWALLF